MAEIPYKFVQAGERVFSQGDAGDCAYVVESGEIDVQVQEGDVVHHVGIVFAGELLGEMSILEDRPRSANAIARTDARLMVVEREQINARLQAADPVLRLILEGLLGRLRQQLMQRRAAEAAMLSLVAAPRNDDAIARIVLENELRAALASGEMAIHIQPISSMAGGRIAGFETLVRWHHPARGMLAPDLFIKRAEESGLIVPLGRWILHEACVTAMRFEREENSAGLKGKQSFISVNVSSLQIYDPDFLPALRRALQVTGLDPKRLKLEITESVLTNAIIARQWIADCKALGVRIALDDFGTGYSSLSYLHDFDIDTLKVDQSFVHKMLDDARSAKIVATIVTLAHTLGLETIAEGIETQEQHDALAKLGCDFAQGYLIARPQPIESYFV